MQLISVQQFNQVSGQVSGQVPGYVTTGAIDTESFQVLLAKLIRVSTGIDQFF